MSDVHHPPSAAEPTETLMGLRMRVFGKQRRKGATAKELVRHSLTPPHTA